MGGNQDEQIDSLLHGVDSFLTDFDKGRSSAQAGEHLDPAGREKLIQRMFDDAEPNMDGSTEIRVSEDEMLVTLDCYPPHGEGSPISLEAVEQQVLQAGVLHGIDWETIKETLFSCNTERRQIEGVRIAAGEEPKPEVPEHLLIKKSLLKKPRAPTKGGGKQIDHRSYSPFTIVEQGEVLAKLRRARKGAFGRTVRGAARPYGTRKIPQLSPGENTAWKGDAVVATCHGRFISGSSAFAVREVLEITTDVDYHTGNIDFPGDVILYGEVSDRFTINSGASIYCSSTLDAHRVSCKGNLIVSGGIIGRKDGVVKAGGYIRSKFIENCYIEAGGLIYVKTGIINSVVNTRAALSMGKRGAIIGGKMFAQDGVEAAQIGTSSETRTEINCGVDFAVQQKLLWIKDAHLQLLAHKKRIEEQLSRTGGDEHELQKKKDALSEKIRRLSEASISLLDKLDRNDAATVKVRDIIYSGVYIEICHTSYVVKGHMRSIQFALDKTQGSVYAREM